MACFSVSLSGYLQCKFSLTYRFNVPVPSEDRIREISKAVADATGLSLFGYDLIRSRDTGKYAITPRLLVAL